MAENETRVIYRAIADFSAVAREARKARREIAALRAEEAALNRTSARGHADTASAAQRSSSASRSEAASVRESTSAHREHTSAVASGARATASASAATSRATTVAHAFSNALSGSTRAAHNQANAAQRMAGAMNNGTNHTGRFRGAVKSALPVVEKFNGVLDRLGKWRPHLMPPFIALVPIIAGLLSLLNPLVAGLGAVGGAAIGFASSLGRIAGAALGVIPALFSLMSVVAALKVAFGGIGGVFSAYKSMKKAGGGGGGGKSSAPAEITQAEKIARARETLRRATENLRWAEEDLAEARKEYIKRLEELQEAADNAANAEKRAIAQRENAEKNLARVMADPNSSKAEKMAALAAVEDAKTAEEKAKDRNKELQDDLADMKKKGMKGDREVIMAQRALTDAIWAQRDAQIALVNAKRGDAKASGGGASAMDAYNEALKKLSPSARKFVLGLIAMEKAWTKVRKATQESFFSKIVKDLPKLRSMLPTVQSLLTDTAGALGDVAHEFISMISSPEWKSDLVLLGRGNVPIIKNIGRGLNDLWGIFKDLAVIAQPFLTMLTEGFKKGTENLTKMVDAARKSGSLSEWLMGGKSNGGRGVLQTLQQWWRILKNIGKTIFNYSKAASDFANWITDGMEKATEGWLKASENATKKDSPFQIWLENIKPLLSEISRMFGTFFKWFGKEASDPKNIEQMTEIFRTITDKLGPALGKLFDTLSAQDIGPKFIDAVVKIVDIIAELVDSPATLVFFETLNFLLDGILSVLKNPVFGPMLKLMLTVFSGLAAITFVSNFFGIENFIGKLIKWHKGGQIKAFFDTFTRGFGNIARWVSRATGWKLPAWMLGAGLPKRAIIPGGNPGGSKGGGGSTVVGSGGGGSSKGGKYSKGKYSKNPGVPTRAKGSVKLPFGKSAGLLGKGGGLLKGLLGGAGGIASIVGTIAGDAISGSAAGGKAGATQRVGGSVLSGVASGAGLGALIGSIIFPGIGTAAGAGVGGAIGGVGSYMGASDEDKAAMNEQIGKWFEDTAKTISDWWTNTVVPAFTGVGENIGKWWQDTVVTPFQKTGENIGKWWQDTVVTPFNNTATQIGDWWNNEVVIPMSELATTISQIWQQYVVTPFTNAATQVTTWWNENVVIPFSTAATAVSTWWNDNVVKRFNDVAGKVQAWWNDNVVKRFQAVAGRVQSWWNDNVVKRFNAVAGKVGEWWQTNVVNRFNEVAGAIQRLWSDAISAIRNFNPIEAFNQWLKNTFHVGEQNRHNGGPIRRAGGGSVPGHGNSDTVPARLTPGEFVVRKAIVGRVGLDNLVKLNSGVMSFAEMLRQAAEDQHKPKESFAFNGGGLVPSLPGSGGTSAPPGPKFPKPGEGGGTVVNVGGIHVYNPVPERATNSMSVAAQKLSALGLGGDL